MTEDKSAGIRHIAFIMDGNGRWAQKRHLPREFGHKQGADTFRRIAEYCGDIGIGHVTVYAFSTENWKRPKREVEAIFRLFSQYLDYAAETMMKKNIRIVFLGDKGVFSDALRRRMLEIEERSQKNTRILNIAVNYGGRDEITHAVNELLKEGKEKISEADITAHLYTKLSPDPDLIVRTGGEYRLSNYLLWQAAYSELYITDKLWPDFTEADVDAAIAEFAARTRRFGGV